MYLSPVEPLALFLYTEYSARMKYFCTSYMCTWAYPNPPTTEPPQVGAFRNPRSTVPNPRSEFPTANDRLTFGP